MTDYPIIFSVPMVRALLDGQKTQTRRVMRTQPEAFAGGVHPRHIAKHPAPYLDAYCGQRKTPENPRGMGQQWNWWTEDDCCGPTVGKCPFGKPGDRLWVRENWQLHDRASDVCTVAYAASVNHSGWSDASHQFPDTLAGDMRARPFQEAWRPSIHMPRWASRLALVVTDIRAQRLQDISEDDAVAEGLKLAPGGWWSGAEGQAGTTPRAAFMLLWNSIHGPASCNANPWVWAMTFTVHHSNIDALAAHSMATNLTPRGSISEAGA